MSDPSEVIQEAVEKASGSKLNAAVALMVAVTATFVALCNVKDGNVVQAMQQAQAGSVDTWAYFQAKSTKQAIAQGNLDQFRFHRDASVDLKPEQLALLDKRIAESEANVKRYESEKAEIKASADALQKQYDRLNLHDDQFDMAEASLSICIALLGVTALTQKKWLFAVATAIACVGVLLGVAGFLGWTIHPDFLARLLS
jgi:hypothetical protein